MAWVRIESAVARHRKFQQAGPAAAWLWVCSLGYCQESLTDGFIPTECLRYLGVRNASRYVSRLVTVGLWDTVEGGWRIHDYLTYNREASEIRRVQGERRQAGREGGLRSSARRTKQVAEATAQANAQANAKQTANPSTYTSTATTTETETVGARSAPPPAPARGAAPLHDTAHRKHALCGRVCLPAAVLGEFVQRRNHDHADAELRQWAALVIDAWTVGAHAHDEPGDVFTFWRTRYAEEWPAADAATSAQSRLPKWLQDAQRRKAAEG